MHHRPLSPLGTVFRKNQRRSPLSLVPIVITRQLPHPWCVHALGSVPRVPHREDENLGDEELASWALHIHV
jgi:hypothetical protein